MHKALHGTWTVGITAWDQENLHSGGWDFSHENFKNQSC